MPYRRTCVCFHSVLACLRDFACMLKARLAQWFVLTVIPQSWQESMWTWSHANKSASSTFCESCRANFVFVYVCLTGGGTKLRNHGGKRCRCSMLRWHQRHFGSYISEPLISNLKTHVPCDLTTRFERQTFTVRSTEECKAEEMFFGERVDQRGTESGTKSMVRPW